MRASGLALVLLLACSGLAAAPAEPTIDIPALAAKTATRFPQPVRVGDLIGRLALAPTEAQEVLGRVVAVTQRADGGVDAIIRLGGILGIGARRIVVPMEAVSVLGEYVTIVDFTPQQLQAFPTAPDPAGPLLPPERMLSVALSGPFH